MRKSRDVAQEAFAIVKRREFAGGLSEAGSDELAAMFDAARLEGFELARELAAKLADARARYNRELGRKREMATAYQIGFDIRAIDAGAEVAKAADPPSP